MDASWSIKHLSPQQGRKVWGMGSGYFDYEFTLPSGIDTSKLGSVEFRAELAARYPQEKYLEEGEAEGIGMTVVSNKGTIPGYGKNSYPQTDEKKFSSTVVISANGQKIGETVLPDDPADHRGILSWVSQEPGWEWGSKDHSKRWLLDEAGSYGYLVKIPLDKAAVRIAIETGKIVICLRVNDSDAEHGGLTVYGKESGRFPLDPSIIIKPE
jgi:predicted transcriptional regulator